MRRGWFKVGLPVMLALLLLGSITGSASAAAEDDKAEKAKAIAEKIEKDLEEKGDYSKEDLDELIGLLEDLANVKLTKEKREMAKNYVLQR